MNLLSEVDESKYGIQFIQTVSLLRGYMSVALFLCICTVFTVYHLERSTGCKIVSSNNNNNNEIPQKKKFLQLTYISL